MRKGCLKIRKEDVTVFFSNYSSYEGEPARLYRSPERIREDILDIKTKIETVKGMLNVRNILTEVIDEYAKGEPEKWIPALSEIVAEAEDTLDRLKKLREDLDMLSEELEDTVWALAM
jgi:seryl-tRNA synthetase